LQDTTKRDWEKRAKTLLEVSLLEKEMIEKRRFLFSSTVYLEIDEQGRFVLPRSLLEYAGLDGKVVIVGVGDHFEIWSPERWTRYLKEVKN
jgi:MraZ protein